CGARPSSPRAQTTGRDFNGSSDRLAAVTDQKVGRAYVSTGHLPSPRQVQAAVDEAYRLYRAEASGATSQTYPALARASGHLFGICVAGVGGSMYRAGDSGHEF